MRSRLVSRILFNPSRSYVPCRKEEVLLPTSWGRIQLWREYSDDGGAARRRDTGCYFLRFLGSRGRAEMATLDPADRIPDVAAEVWTMNAPGFGGTTGPPDLGRYAECAISALSHLQRTARGKPLLVCGKSIGTTAALAAVATLGASALILRNPMPLRELLIGHYGWRTLGLSTALAARAVPPNLDSLANARRCRCPALFLMSRDDRIVPPAYQQRVIDAYGGPTTVLNVAGGHDERVLASEDEARYGNALRNMIHAL